MGSKATYQLPVISQLALPALSFRGSSGSHASRPPSLLQAAKAVAPENMKTCLFSPTKWDRWVGLSTCRHQLKIKAHTGWSRPKRKKGRKAPLNPLQTWPGLLRGKRCGNSPNLKATPSQGSRRRKDHKETGWLGVEGSKRKQPKIQRKEGGQAEGITPPSSSFKAGLSLRQGLRGKTGEQTALSGDSCTQVRLGTVARGAASWRENRLAWLWKGEGRCSLLFSQELERTELSPMNLARPNFLPQGEFFPVLGKHTWLEFACPGPGAQSFLPSGWSLGEIKRLADTKHFDVKNRWQETKNKH